MISKLRPASRAQFVSFGNVAAQDLIRASTWGFEARGVPSADVGCLLRLRAMGCLLPVWGALGCSIVP